MRDYHVIGTRYLITHLWLSPHCENKIDFNEGTAIHLKEKDAIQEEIAAKQKELDELQFQEASVTLQLSAHLSHDMHTRSYA